MALKDWKKTKKNFWENKYRATAIYITIIGNPKFGKIDTYAVTKINFYGVGSPYEKQEVLKVNIKTLSQALKFAKSYLKEH